MGIRARLSNNNSNNNSTTMLNSYCTASTNRKNAVKTNQTPANTTIGSNDEQQNSNLVAIVDENSTQAASPSTKSPLLTIKPTTVLLHGARASHAFLMKMANKNKNLNSNSNPNNDVVTAKTVHKARTTCTLRSTSASDIIATSSTSSSSSSSSSLYVRPQTLNVHNTSETPTEHTELFCGKLVNAWRAKVRSNVASEDRIQELFQELNFHPSERQIKEMLQAAKMLAHKGYRQSNGLTFGEIFVLAADLKRFRSTGSCSTTPLDKLKPIDGSALYNENQTDSKNSTECSSNSAELRSTKSYSNVEDCRKTNRQKKISSTEPTSGGTSTSPVQVFLGGSCNPTTWRADVAIPALKEYGISFYNPQVSDWTPDLIELEHRAKEKARVLFFVMDSETRASAGAIEAAHIAGQNCKQLVLVLHPYKPNQYILDEPISEQEYQDLLRNQLILRELVTRRGLPVLDNIPMGLQRTKDILYGKRDPPSPISTILSNVRGAFDRVNPVNESLSTEQCQLALSYLGYAQSLLSLENLNRVIHTQREQLLSLHHNQQQQQQQHEQSTNSTVPPDRIDFELFCVVSAYLSVLQQEIHESGCISPIKGTNVPPPPVYLTNMQAAETYSMCNYSCKNVLRTLNSNSASSTSVPLNADERALNASTDSMGRGRDSGTSSPQPPPLDTFKQKLKTKILVNYELIEQKEQLSPQTTTTTTTQAKLTMGYSSAASSPPILNEDESDSNDSVFSSNSSINSVNCSGSSLFSASIDYLPNSCFNVDFRDVYLGGSCYLRTKWRQEIAMPYLKSKCVTFHLPALHESLTATQSSASGEKIFAAHQHLTQQPAVASGNNESTMPNLTALRPNLYNPALLEASRVLLFVITNETRSLAPMTLAAHCIGLMYNVVLAVQMLPDDCVIGNEKLTTAAIKDYNRGRSYLIDLAKRQGVPVFTDLKAALECTVDKVKATASYSSIPT